MQNTYYSCVSSTSFSNYFEVYDKISGSGSAVLKQSQVSRKINKSAHRYNFLKKYIIVRSYGSYSD